MNEKIIVITGVTRGLGRAMAEEFADQGHRVAGCGRSGASISQMRDRFGSGHLLREVDVTDVEAVENWARETADTLGVPDLILNNAALINHTAPLWEVPPEEFAQLVEVNINGTVNVIRAFLPILRQGGKGVIVNFSSGWGRSVSAGVAPYCATKWAIEGLTQALALELPDGLSTVALNPGTIDTEMLRSCFGDEAGNHAPPSVWARRAVPFILSLGHKDNGRPLTVS